MHHTFPKIIISMENNHLLKMMILKWLVRGLQSVDFSPILRQLESPLLIIRKLKYTLSPR